MKARGRKGGFTLIELLASTALFAVLGLLLFELSRGATELWNSGERNREVHDRAQTALELMALDLRHLWAGTPGAAEQDARLIAAFREEDVDGNGTTELRTTVLAFTRMLHEARELAWLRRAGDRAGAEGEATLLGLHDPRELRPTSGLAESLYTVAILPGERLPALIRRMRSPIGGQGTLVDTLLFDRADRLKRDAVPIADGVLHFGVELWGPATTAWVDLAGPDDVPALIAWDSTRAGLATSFPYHVGESSLFDATDDMFPRLVKLTLILDARLPTGKLRQDVSVEATRIDVSSVKFLGDESVPDHVLIDREWMAIQSVQGTELRVERGARGTNPEPHDAGSAVRIGRPFDRIVAPPATRENFNS